MSVLADQFRDGSVPASQRIQELVDEAYTSLPAGAWQVSVRSDSAAYEQAVLDHWDSRGWRFGVLNLVENRRRQLRFDVVH